MLSGKIAEKYTGSFRLKFRSKLAEFENKIFPGGILMLLAIGKMACNLQVAFWIFRFILTPVPVLKNSGIYS